MRKYKVGEYVLHVSSCFCFFFVEKDYDMKSFCDAIVYLQTMKGFHDECVAAACVVLITSGTAACSTGISVSSLLKK